jgi:hypothetical protein
MEILTLIVALVGLIITVLGWGFTYYKQKELAEIQGGIQKSISEHDIRFETLHTKRVEIMKNLYVQLNEISKVMGNYKLNELWKYLSPFMEYCDKNDLFLDNKLSEMLKNMTVLLNEFGITETNMVDAYQKGFVDNARHFQERNQELRGTIIPPLLNEIKMEMQRTLGVLE